MVGAVQGAYQAVRCFVGRAYGKIGGSVARGDVGAELMKRLIGFLLLGLFVPSCNRGGPAGTPDPRQVVARVGGQPITLGELDQALARELQQLRRRKLEQLVVERALEPEARKAQLSVEQYLRRQVEAQVPAVTEAEAEAFFAKNHERMGPQLAGKRFADIKAVVIEGLTGPRRSEAMKRLIAETQRKAGVQILLPDEPPR